MINLELYGIFRLSFLFITRMVFLLPERIQWIFSLISHAYFCLYPFWNHMEEDSCSSDAKTYMMFIKRNLLSQSKIKLVCEAPEKAQPERMVKQDCLLRSQRTHSSPRKCTIYRIYSLQPLTQLQTEEKFDIHNWNVSEGIILNTLSELNRFSLLKMQLVYFWSELAC